MKKQNAVKLVGFFVISIVLAIFGLAFAKSHLASHTLSSPPLGASLEGDKTKIYKIKVKKSDASKGSKTILGFSAETAKALGIDGEADFEKDLDLVPSEKGEDDYTKIIKENKSGKPKIVKSDYDYSAVKAELDRIKAAEEKALKAEEAQARKQSQLDSQAILKDVEKEKKLKAKYKKQVEMEINGKYYIHDVDYEYEGLTE